MVFAKKHNFLCSHNINISLIYPNLSKKNFMFKNIKTPEHKLCSEHKLWLLNINMTINYCKIT